MRTKAWMAAAALALGSAIAAPAAAQDYAAQDYYDYRTGEEHRFARFRFGVSGLGGGQWESGPDLGMGGLAVRVGVQLGDWFAVYYQPTGMIGSIVDRDPGRDSVAGVMWNTAMAEAVILDFLQIGAGPSMDFTWGCDEDIQDEIGCATSDVFFGMDARVALAMGNYGPGERQAFVIEARAHSTWYEDDELSIAVLGGLGFELY